jgi:hypothetical protein
MAWLRQIKQLAKGGVCERRGEVIAKQFWGLGFSVGGWCCICASGASVGVILNLSQRDGYRGCDSAGPPLSCSDQGGGRCDLGGSHVSCVGVSLGIWRVT